MVMMGDLMKYYARLLYILVCLNIISCSFLTVYGILYPKNIYAGSNMNSLGWLFGMIGLHVTAVLIGIFYVNLGDNITDKLIVFNKYNIPIYIILGINIIYRLYFSGELVDENGLTTTSIKLMATYSLALGLNFSALIIIRNYLKMIGKDKQVVK